MYHCRNHPPGTSDPNAEDFPRVWQCDPAIWVEPVHLALQISARRKNHRQMPSTCTLRDSLYYEEKIRPVKGISLLSEACSTYYLHGWRSATSIETSGTFLGGWIGAAGYWAVPPAGADQLYWFERIVDCWDASPGVWSGWEGCVVFTGEIGREDEVDGTPWSPVWQGRLTIGIDGVILGFIAAESQREHSRIDLIERVQILRPRVFGNSTVSYCWASFGDYCSWEALRMCQMPQRNPPIRAYRTSTVTQCQALHDMHYPVMHGRARNSQSIIIWLAFNLEEIWPGTLTTNRPTPWSSLSALYYSCISGWLNAQIQCYAPTFCRRK